MVTSSTIMYVVYFYDFVVNYGGKIRSRPTIED